MSILVRLRIELADTPGALAQVAAMIAGHGGNISAIDVQQGSASSAVDEVTVEFADGADLSELRRSLEGRGAARVLSHQTADPADLVVRVMQWLARLLAAPPVERYRALGQGVAELCSTPAAWVSTAAEAGEFEVGRMALRSRGEAVLARTGEPPAALAGTMSGEVVLLAIADRVGPVPERVVFVARPPAQRFTATEIRRLEELMALHERVEGMRTSALEPTSTPP
jgi:ACT domain